MPGKKRVALALSLTYVGLLGASHLVRWQRATPPTPPEIRTETLEDSLVLAYRQLGTDSTNAAPVLLLHGSPGSSRDFARLAPALATGRRVVAPDLPGFGFSSRRISNYSIEAHGRYILTLMDRLGIGAAHLVGFSMGGGVALEMARQAPDRVSSLTLLSSIGVQELELLGDYHLNRSVHGLQLGLLYLLHEATPHFGLLDRFPLNIQYGRNFYDTDQRPLRAVLARLDAPTLIVHGRRDVLVPIAAAREHHRLVPQSELVVLDADHFIVFRGEERLEQSISSFLERVEEGEARTRRDADASRLERASLPFSTKTLPAASGIALFVLMFLLAVATFASEDLASIGAGLLVAQGRIGFVAGAVACIVGILIGDVAIYLGGRIFGRPWIGRRPFRWLVSPGAVERSRAWFGRRGPSIIFVSRFLPGTRVATYFAAGVLGTGLWKFLLYLGAAVVLWVPLIVGAAAVLGSRVFGLFEGFARFALPGVLGLAILAWLLFRLARGLLTRRGRRLLVGTWKRWRHWEFWPRWLFYPPVFMQVIRLGSRHGGLTLFTAANPALPAGGFVGESKSAILARLEPRAVARFLLLAAESPLEKKAALVHDFMQDFGLSYPVVLKPDVGERGTGVLVARGAESVHQHLAAANFDLLVQEFVPGVELGVFYIRSRDEAHGRIFSITEKRLPEVVGDGTATVEELILRDERAVAMAPTYLERLAQQLERIPPGGERVRLVDVGTHCLGADFRDGRRLETPALAQWIDELSRGFEGFHFGRYDLRAPSLEAFQRAESIRVIELNGVTSEATHIYDPDNSVIDAYRVLFRQWELAFEIGRRNADAGAPITPVRDLLRALWSHARR